MPTVDRLAVELAADLNPLRQAFAEAEQMAGTAVADLSQILGGEGAGEGVFALLSDGASVAARAIRGALVDAVSGAEVEWNEVLSRMALRLSDLVLDDTLNAALAAASGGGGGDSGGSAGGGLAGLLGSLFGGFRAGGGPVRPDRAYVVGEAGPELFVPDGTGEIVPRQAAATTPAPSVTINVTTADAGSFRRSQGQIAAAMSRALAAAQRYS
ncbi:tail tape measure protein [Zavarzinia compransoris]|uniref:Tail tape measure protein n=1 Tax=Zavarzinia compransoris TaxID=1264899 RepID=A0A317DXF7_9PROT|nr:tail tape measure protein [Zavarzinia compransoris]PWR19152.1 tail tape measure protein [Zavarzinia compransoris]TDP49166.1 hypothetical protein DES42_101534 [Zavarzinia compransoris]